MVLTEAAGLAPADVEQQVTFPIELAMQGLPDVRRIRSLSKAAFSQVIVVFEDHVDTYFARQLVFQRLQSAKKDLPEWAEPEMGPISTGLGEIYQYTLESDTRSLMELRTIQDWIIAPQLRSLPGVNEVNSFGGFVKQYHVLVGPSKLIEYGVTLSDVIEAIKENNANAGGNFLVKGWEQAYVRSVGLIQTIADIENIVLKAEDGTPIYLKNIATVQVGPMTRQGAITRDGKGERVAGMVIMLKDENSKLVVDRVKKSIPKIQDGLPKDVRINTFYDRSALIQACIRTVLFAVLIIVIVFFPLFTLQEMEGKMFRPLALTMCFAMAGSLLVSFTIVPVLCSIFLKRKKVETESFLIRVLKKGYMRFLDAALRRRWTTVLVAVWPACPFP